MWASFCTRVWKSCFSGEKISQTLRFRTDKVQVSTFVGKYTRFFSVRPKSEERQETCRWDLGPGDHSPETTVSPETRNQRVWLNSPSPQVRWHETFWASSEAICHTVLLRQMKFPWVETSFMISKGNLIVWKQRVGLVSTLGYALAASSTLKEHEESLTMTAADEFPQGSHYLLGHVAVLF